MTMSSSEWQMKVTATADTADLTQGLSVAEDSVRDLESTVDRATDDINSSLRRMDDGVSSSLGSGGTFNRSMDEGEAGVGRLKDSVGEIPGSMQDMADGAASAASGLANAFASMGPLGIGIGSALSLFAILKTKSDEAAQAMRDSINSALDSIEVKAKQSNEQIIAAYEKTLTFEKTVTDLGQGDRTKGFGILAEHAENLGVSVATLVEFINGKWNPATLALLGRMREQVAAVKEQNDGLQQGSRFVHQLGGDWYFLLQQQRKQVEVGRQAVEQAEQQRDYMRDTAEAARSYAGWLAAAEARQQGINNKLAAAQNYYNGMPGSGT